MILYVETHWILSVVHAEEWDATKLLVPPEHGAPQIHLPAFCIAEAIARFRTLEREANDFVGRLKKRQHDAGRMQHHEARRLVAALESTIEEQQELIVALSSEFNAFIETIFASDVVLIPDTSKAIKRANGYVQLLKMSRGDAVILGAVIEHAAGQGASRKAFLSGNTADFGSSTPAGKELESAGIKSFASVKGALGWLGAGAPPSEPAA